MNDISQNNGALRFASVGWWWDGSTKEQQHLPLQRQLSWAFKSSESYPDLCLCSPHPEGNQFSFFLYVPGTFQVAAPASLEKNETVHWLLKRKALDCSNLLSQFDTILVGFTASCYGNSSSWYWYPVQSWNPSLWRGNSEVKIFHPFLNHHIIYICPLPSYQSCGGFFF